MLEAAVIIAGIAISATGIFIALLCIVLAILALFFFWWREIHRPIGLTRSDENPILSPDPAHWWESEAVFNPAAFVAEGKVHLLYRALGNDGISRIGYASSKDGIHFERLPYPVYAPDRGFSVPTAPHRYGPLSYNTIVYPSGGGWGGVEDPRIVQIDNTMYMTFVAFDGWGFVRMALTSLPVPQFSKKNWHWKPAAFLSPPNEVHKNWVLFPDKVNGKYAILHSVSPTIQISYVDSLKDFDEESVYIHSRYSSSGREGHWDNWVRGAGPPPLKTEAGWLLLYHAMDKNDPNKYKVGAMLLDLTDPSKVLYRSEQPILEPKMNYENNWKPGVVYACGAVIWGNDLLVYYGGGDKYVAVARANLRDFLRQLTSYQHAQLKPVRV
jgi:predicted GH43/DUF377 family glycosyl hydrolase